MISCAACEELRQAVLLELASDCQRQFSFADELHHARNLVGSKLTAAKRQKVGFVDALSRLAHDERRQLAAYKIPRMMKFVSEAELPLTVTGKLQKNRLAEFFTRGA